MGSAVNRVCRSKEKPTGLWKSGQHAKAIESRGSKAELGKLEKKVKLSRLNRLSPLRKNANPSGKASCQSKKGSLS